MTMIVYRRLLAGFTSCISNLCFSHFCSIGPSGILASSTTEGVGSTGVRIGAGGAGAPAGRGGGGGGAGDGFLVGHPPPSPHPPPPPAGGGGGGGGGAIFRF